MRYFLIGSLLFLLWLVNDFASVLPVTIDPKLPAGFVILCGTACVFLTVFWRKRKSSDLIFAIAVFGVFLGGVRCVRDIPENRLKQTYAGIRVGMTLAELEAVVRREFSDEMPPIDINETGGFIGPAHGGTNSDYISFDMNHGRLTGKDYLPD